MLAALRFSVRLIPFVGLVGAAVATLIAATTSDHDLTRELFLNSIFWMVGIQGWMTGCGHMFFGEPIAESIGWPAKTPWQFEVGLASVATGLRGVMVRSFGAEFWLATILAFSVFYLGAAVGHVREMIVEKNFAPGNSGPIFFFDVLVPIYLIVLYTVVVH